MNNKNKYFPIWSYSLREGKKKFYALYGVFREKNGIIEGYTEHSFSMEWDRNKVSICCYKHAQDRLKYLIKKHPNGGRYFIYRLTRRGQTKNKRFCPMKLFWNIRKSSIDKKYDKFDFRNIGFRTIDNIKI
jgi:hypothetical protein